MCWDCFIDWIESKEKTIYPRIYFRVHTSFFVGGGTQTERERESERYFGYKETISDKRGGYIFWRFMVGAVIIKINKLEKLEKV